MKKAQMFHWVIITIAAMVGGLCSCSEQKHKPPNIIYILADDLGYGDLGCYGQKTLTTPHIDRLAGEGMRFTQHYAGSTVCAPSRSALLTGKHTGHCSVRGNAPDGQLTEDEEITIPEALKDAGYVSAVIGKWGIGHPPPPDDPLRNGFDHAYGYINMWHAHNFYPEFLYEDGQKVSLEGNELDTSYNYRADMPEGTGIAREKGTYVLFKLEEKALQFIEHNQGGPFFLFLALNMPHANNEAGFHTGNGMEVPSYGAYENMEWPDPEKGFAQMITLIDETVGKVQEKVRELGIDEHTLIMFSSDNGPHQEGGHDGNFFDSNGPLRGFKRDLYEGGIRVPLIVRWPGRVAPGSESDHVAAFWDVLPTFCAIAGTDQPVGADGISFLPTLLGTGGQRTHEYLYWEFYEMGGRQAVRKGDWKYVKLHVRDESREAVRELYDMTADKGESRNLAQKEPGIVAQMEGILEEAHRPSPFMSLFSEVVTTDMQF